MTKEKMIKREIKRVAVLVKNKENIEEKIGYEIGDFVSNNSYAIVEVLSDRFINSHSRLSFYSNTSEAIQDIAFGILKDAIMEEVEKKILTKQEYIDEIARQIEEAMREVEESIDLEEDMPQLTPLFDRVSHARELLMKSDLLTTENIYGDIAMTKEEVKKL